MPFRHTAAFTSARRWQHVERAAVCQCERRRLEHVLQRAPGAKPHGVLVDVVHEHDEQHGHVSGRQRRPGGLRVGRYYIPRGRRVVGHRLRAGHPGRQHVRERLQQHHQRGHL